jgi:hypothetical protein
VIPDDKLAQIFHDIYLVNGYVSQSGLKVDSLNIYEPILEAHGYTSEDVQYTIGNFAKRKSARLSDDVVGVASEMLRRESNFYRGRLAIRDTIAAIARRKYADTVWYANKKSLDSALKRHTGRLPRPVVDSLRVIYHLPDSVAVARLAGSWGDWQLLDTLIKSDETTLGPPFADSLRTAAR